MANDPISALPDGAGVVDAGLAVGVDDPGGSPVTVKYTWADIKAYVNAGGPLDFQGLWDADTNTPTLSSGVGTEGHAYVVSVAGSTNLDGITDWNIADWAVFTGGAWRKVDNTQDVHAMGGPLHSADTLANINTKVSDADLQAQPSEGPFVDGDKTKLDNTDAAGTARPPTAHALAGADHTADLLANLNSKVSDLIATYGGIRDFGVGVVANRPAFGTANRFWWATDELLLYRDTGAAWEQLQAGSPPGGVDTQVQFNNAGAFGGSADFVWTGTRLDITGDVGIIDGHLNFDDGIRIGSPSTGSGIFTGAAIAIGDNAGGPNQQNGMIAIGQSACGAAGDARVATVAIGASAIGLGTGGQRSVAVGNNTLEDLSSGSSNTGMGDATLRNVTTGSDNTAIGAGAGNAATTNGGGVFLGRRAGEYETGANTLFIDNQDRTDEATGRLNAMVYGIFNAVRSAQQLFLNAVVAIRESLTVETLNTGDEIITTDNTGKLQESGAKVTAAPAGGSGIAVVEYASAPVSPPAGMIWIQAKDASTKTFNYYDGTSTFSVDLSL
jgi:hypothetical protein